MAYSLNDPYRLYRYVLRTNALLCGLGLGLLLLGQPHWATDLLGWPMPRQALWPVRLGGAGLAGMGHQALVDADGRHPTLNSEREAAFVE